MACHLYRLMGVISVEHVLHSDWMSFAWTLNVCVSFPGMMQGDNENIKMNLGIASCSRLIRFCRCILSL